LVELTISLAVTSLILATVAISMSREARGLSEMANRDAEEQRVSEMLGRIENTLRFASGANPQAFLSGNLSAGQTAGMNVDTTLGFPAFGVLLLEPGTGAEERIAYDRINPVAQRFEELDRGAQCGSASLHPKNQIVRWAGMATPIENQLNPPPGTFDGLCLEPTGGVFFRGDGTGFSFRVPTDPGGGEDFLENGAVRWGATIDGQPTLDGWSALYYQEVGELLKAQAGADLNGDGDRIDIFDLGRIRMISWNAFAAGQEMTDVAMCPPIVLQERCNWGSDLDGDGFDDPLFMWEPETGCLHVRLFLAAGTVNGRQSVREIESILYLRNGALE